MSDKIKALLCIGGMIGVLLIGIILNTNNVMGWFSVMTLGFGWYARGSLNLKNGKVKA